MALLSVEHKIGGRLLLFYHMPSSLARWVLCCQGTIALQEPYVCSTTISGPSWRLATRVRLGPVSLCSFLQTRCSRDGMNLTPSAPYNLQGWRKGGIISFCESDL